MAINVSRESYASVVLRGCARPQKQCTSNNSTSFLSTNSVKNISPQYTARQPKVAVMAASVSNRKSRPVSNKYASCCGRAAAGITASTSVRTSQSAKTTVISGSASTYPVCPAKAAVMTLPMSVTNSIPYVRKHQTLNLCETPKQASAVKVKMSEGIDNKSLRTDPKAMRDMSKMPVACADYRIENCDDDHVLEEVNSNSEEEEVQVLEIDSGCCSLQSDVESTSVKVLSIYTSHTPSAASSVNTSDHTRELATIVHVSQLDTLPAAVSKSETMSTPSFEFLLSDDASSETILSCSVRQIPFRIDSAQTTSTPTVPQLEISNERTLEEVPIKTLDNVKHKTPALQSVEQPITARDLLKVTQCPGVMKNKEIVPPNKRLSLFVCPSNLTDSESDSEDDEEEDDDDWDSPTTPSTVNFDEMSKEFGCITGLYIPPPTKQSSDSDSTPTRSLSGCQFGAASLGGLFTVTQRNRYGTVDDDDDIVFDDDVKSIEEDSVTVQEKREREMRINEANTHWNEVYERQEERRKGVSTVICHAGTVFSKRFHNKVRFSSADAQRIPVLNESMWAEEYAEARVGPWETFRRDRDRFLKHIQELEQDLAWVFSAEHRRKIYESSHKTKRG